MIPWPRDNPTDASDASRSGLRASTGAVRPLFQNSKVLLKDERKVISQKGGKMFQVSEKATEMIKEHFKDKETIPSIRVILSQGG